jgi:small subunit ribosomal protein S27e
MAEKKHFLKVKCHACGNEQTIFARVSTVVKCQKCSAEIAQPTGGKSAVKGEILEAY